jgi:hypothetical protein
MSTVYAMNIRGTPTLRSFPVNDPSQISHVVAGGFSTYAMDFDASATNLYAIRNSDGGLVTIDLITGAPTLVTPTSGYPLASITGLTVDPNNNFYLSTSTALYALNSTTGAALLIGAFNTGGVIIDISADVNGNLYGYNVGTDALYSINKSSGSATLIGVSGYATNFAQGMDFDWATNTLYATLYTGGGTGQYVTFNLATGAATSLGATTAFNVEMEMAVQSPAPTPVPEPATLGVLALGSAALFRWRSRR